jgi:hypothetical protein
MRLCSLPSVLTTAKKRKTHQRPAVGMDVEIKDLDWLEKWGTEKRKINPSKSK